jgi:eukaryotic-like serine/threonine-protein kinase
MSDGDSQRLIGTVLQDSYRIDRLIGEGGMGAVFEGTQLRLNRRVAIKVMSRELTSNQEALGRFRREAELTSQLGHPHIVQVLDWIAGECGD